MRLTYITFDPMMTIEELIASFLFQGRKDALLQRTDASLEQLYDDIGDPNYCRVHATGKPIYFQIPYMLVSLEGLFGSAYLRKAQREGLTKGESINLAMGRSNIRYRDDV